MLARDPSNPAHVFTSDDVAVSFPSLYSCQVAEEPVARLKSFTPDSSWTWCLPEYDPEQRLAFGLVIGHTRARTRLLLAARA